MFFFEILLFYISIILVSLSISGYGRLINFQIRDNFFIDIFLGLIFITLTITIFHFFYSINIIFSFSIFIFGLIIFFHKRKFNFLRLFEKKNFFCVIINFFLVTIFIYKKYKEVFCFFDIA